MMNYLRKWNFMRVFRLAIAVAILIQGIQMGEWIWIVAGVVFSVMPLMNIGCCGPASCVPSRPEKTGFDESISYEEVK